MVLRNTSVVLRLLTVPIYNARNKCRIEIIGDVCMVGPGMDHAIVLIFKGHCSGNILDPDAAVLGVRIVKLAT